ncbi:MAG TPA: DUF1501 domain-containing protein [Actinomycetes bacterium]|nr:DUF1501 domain-containing protein [Actinomycetes bacterium]
MSATTCGCPDYTRSAISRRAFLGRLGAVGAMAGLTGTGLSTQMAFAATPYTGDVLVVLSLRGGLDGLNTIVPTGDERYLQARPHIGIPQNALIPLDAMFGLHPAMAPLVPFWEAGTFAAVQAVGMTNPTRSHFEAMEEMERAAPGSSVRTGWLDRTLGLRDAGTAFQAVQMGSSMAVAAFRGPAAELAMWSVNDFELSGAWDATERQRWTTALGALHDGAPATVGDPASTTLSALSDAAEMQDAGYTPVTPYPATNLGRALRDVARVIKADVGLQVAAVDFGDWDMHTDLGDVDSGWLYDKLDELANSMAAFATDLGNRFNDVTVVTLTEFGRSLVENGSGGVDHGHGQAVLLLGGGVQGGQVHGTWPTLEPDALAGGDLAGTTDYRQLLAEILEKRCEGSEMSTVFPGLTSDRLGIVRSRSS